MSDIENYHYGLGAIKDPYDPRDFIYEIPAGATTYPLGYQLERFPVKNQGSINSCVAHSIALIKEIQEFYETGKRLTFSVGWIYGYRKQGQYFGQGMYPKEALSNLREWGNVEFNDFPENLEFTTLQNLVNSRKGTCLINGKKWKISSYQKVTTPAAVKSCIYDRHSPVMIIVDIYDNFYTIGADGKVPFKSGNYQGSHAMTIIGWTCINGVDYYVVQNSWGDQWGDNGICYIRSNNDIITDMYTLVDNENEKIKFSDVEDQRWSKEAIDKCVKAGLITGFPDGTFRPIETITREQICSMFAKMLNK
jgi:hypothetical protein